MKIFNKCYQRYAVGFLLVIALVSGVACSSKHDSYVNHYKNAVAEDALSAVDLTAKKINEDWVVKRVNSVMQHLKAPDLQSRVNALYAEKLYFNDTLHTFTDASSLANYLVLTGNRVSMINIDFEDVAIKGKEAYIRWLMHYQLGEKKPIIQSIGMTHFRFNDQGKIVLHQDYWDNVEGFYRVIPVVGFLINKVRSVTGG